MTTTAANYSRSADVKRPRRRAIMFMPSAFPFSVHRGRSLANGIHAGWRAHLRISELRKDDSRAVHSLPDLPVAAKLLPELHGADPVTALDSLRGRLDDLKATVSRDERARNYNLALIKEAGEAHLSALLA